MYFHITADPVLLHPELTESATKEERHSLDSGD